MDIFSSVIQGAYTANKTIYECQISVRMHEFNDTLMVLALTMKISEKLLGWYCVDIDI